MKFTRKPKRKVCTRKMRGGNIFIRFWEFIQSLIYTIFGVNVSRNQAEQVARNISKSGNSDNLADAVIGNNPTKTTEILTKNMSTELLKSINSTVSSSPLNIYHYLEKIKKEWEDWKTFMKPNTDICFCDGKSKISKWYSLRTITNIIIIKNENCNKAEIKFYTEKGSFGKTYYLNSSAIPYISVCPNDIVINGIHLMDDNIL